MRIQDQTAIMLEDEMRIPFSLPTSFQSERMENRCQTLRDRRKFITSLRQAVVSHELREELPRIRISVAAG